MTLVQNLRTVSDFSHVSSLREILAPLLPEGALDDCQVADFLEDTLVLILAEHPKESFMAKLQSLLGRAQLSLNDHVDAVERGLPPDHIQHKESKSKTPKNTDHRP